MLGRLVDTKTSDGIQLHGFFVQPSAAADSIWIIVHGVNGNFYSSTLLQTLASSAIDCGHAALLVNTRGHDLASFGSTDHPSRLGSMFEAIDDGCLDLKAWEVWCREEGYTHVHAMAHSLGAVKLGYALSRGESRCERWVALSPPRLHTELLLADPAKSEVFGQHLEEARTWCAQGKDHHIMRVRFPLPNWVSARTFLDKYGSGDKYDYFAWGASIAAPTLWLFGSIEVREGSVNFRDVDRTLVQKLPSHHALEVIDGADHSYRKTRESLRERLRCWISGNRFSPIVTPGLPQP